MNVNDQDFNFAAFREFIRKADDNFHNSLCVSGDGSIYFRTWGNGVKRPTFPEDGFRFETFCMGNGYVGDGAADDHAFLGRLFRAIKSNWMSQTVGYLDYW